MFTQSTVHTHTHTHTHTHQGEEEDSGDDPEEDDGFFVPHGYLSDDEGQQSDGEKCDPTALAGNVRNHRQSYRVQC